MMKIPLMTFIAAVITLNRGGILAYDTAEETSEYWKTVREKEFDSIKRVFEELNTQQAKNIIILIGDGMSLGSVTAGRIAIGQKMKKDGEEHVTSLDEMPHSGLVKIYSINHQTPDSASTATAFLTGVKTRSGFVGVNAKGRTCLSVRKNSAKSVLEYAAEAGKSTGVVTTTRVQHATPASAYAHAHKRKFYSDRHYFASELPFKSACPDIALQLFNKRRDIQVILGGGRVHMRPPSVFDEEQKSQPGERKDRRNLIAEWKKDMSKYYSASYVWKQSQFDKVDPDKTDYLLGLFSPFDMSYSLNRNYDIGGEPSLAEMTEKAIKILRKNEKGFFLLVESGMLDKGHHSGKARFALEEFHELEKAVRVAKTLTNEKDTLLIATADHGHMFMIGGNGVRGNNVYGLASNHKHNPRKAADKKFFTTILYGNGPGHPGLYNVKAPRQSIGPWVANSRYYAQQSAVPLSSETHSAEDVIVLGSGPMSHLLTGVHEQTHIASVMMYASCLGPEYSNHPHCKSDCSPGSLPARLVGGKSLRSYDFAQEEEGYISEHDIDEL